jgi:hypothetical protein
LLAAIWIDSPVAGLRPVRAGRSFTSRMPRPLIRTRSPFFRMLHVYWVGDYAGTFFSDKGEKSLIDHAGFKCPAWGDIDLNNKKVKEGGVCIITDLDGDRAHATFQGAGMPSHTTGTWEWTGGTGKYTEIKGSNTYAGHFAASWPDGTTSGYVTWNR